MDKAKSWKVDKDFSKHAHPHACPVCGQYTFYDTFSYDDCPVCGWEDGTVGYEDEPDRVLPTNWVSLNEARWIWNKFHCDVNKYALQHKKEALDKLPMDESQ